MYARASRVHHDQLIAKGFTNASISVLLPDDESTRAFAHEKNTKAPEGATAGVTTGGVIGGTLGLLAGIGALAIPGVGPLIAAGPIMASLAGLGIGGAVGGIVGALVGIDVAKTVLKETGARDIAATEKRDQTTRPGDGRHSATPPRMSRALLIPWTRTLRSPTVTLWARPEEQSIVRQAPNNCASHNGDLHLVVGSRSDKAADAEGES